MAPSQYWQSGMDQFKYLCNTFIITRNTVMRLTCIIAKLFPPQNFEMYQQQKDFPLRIVPFWLPVETISLSTTLFILPLHCKVYRRMNGCHPCNFILEYSYILSCIFLYIYVLHISIHVYMYIGKSYS